MKTRSLATALALGLATTAVAASPALAAERGVSMEQACNQQYSGVNAVAHAYLRSSRDAYSWYCGTSGGWNFYYWGGIDVARACVKQHGTGWKVGLRDRYNAYSWYCWK